MPALLVREIFYSIQGEASRAGLPCAFIRLQGCSLRCSWCDTPFAWDKNAKVESLEIEEILSRISSYRCRFVEVTGGEPLEQETCIPLLTRLCDEGYTTALETGGHVDIRNVDPRVIVILDVKCPGSGMEKRNLLSNLEYVKPSDEIKFVLKDRSDYEWARDFMRDNSIPAISRNILFAPAFGHLTPRTLAEWILADYLPVRLQLQIHKYIWGQNTKSV
ncbi:MAG: radical SAM protein [Bacteroidota bacterium]|nr:radical SAM protein [Bacteroidota bacterium]